MEKLKFKYYTQMFSKMFDFGGKSTLSEFWTVVLYNIVFSLCTAIIALPFVVNFNLFAIVCSSLASFYNVIVFIPMLALTTRRLRDANHTTRSFLWLLLPFVGEIIFILYLASPSNSSLNLWPFSHKVTKTQADSNQNEQIYNNVSSEITQNTQQFEEKESELTQKEHAVNDEPAESVNNVKNNDNTNAKNDKLLESEPEQKPIQIDESKVSIADTNVSRSERIKTLQKMHENGEISEAEYQRKVIEILKK